MRLSNHQNFFPFLLFNSLTLRWLEGRWGGGCLINHPSVPILPILIFIFLLSTFLAHLSSQKLRVAYSRWFTLFFLSFISSSHQPYNVG